MYQRIQAVNATEHRNWSVKVISSYDFARTQQFVPVTIHEFGSLASECPLVFTDEDVPRPLAVLGLSSERNQLISEEGKWVGRYVPAYLRRYPFTLAQAEGSDQMVLCCDPESEAFNQEGLGERLFDSVGQRTGFANSVLRFTQEFHGQALQTEAFCKRLKELGLFEPTSAQYRSSSGAEPINLTGFCVINRQRMKSLDAELVMSMLVQDELELIYLHLSSLNQLAKLGDRLS